MEHISLFDLLHVPGDWVTSHGAEMTFEEIAGAVGQKIIMDKSTESHEWFEVVRVESIVNTRDGRRLIYYDGKRQRGMINEIYFDPAQKFPARAYRMI